MLQKQHCQFFVLWAVVCIGACLGTVNAHGASRIISLDYCADQFVLKFADKASIEALSPDAGRAFSYMRVEAIGVPTVRPIAEDVLLKKPDLVVRSYGGSPGITALLERFNVPVLQVGYAQSLDDVRRNILHMSAGLNNPQAGRVLVDQMDERMQAVVATHAANPLAPRALYMTPAGVTSGPNTLVHDMLRAAGYVNYQEKPGWQGLPLERLVFDSPDVVAMAFFETLTDHLDAWSAMWHPIARRQLQKVATVPLQGAWTACGGWFLVDAIESLHAAMITR